MIPGLWLRITMLLEHKIHFILGMLLFLENAIVMLYTAAVFIFFPWFVFITFIGLGLFFVSVSSRTFVWGWRRSSSPCVNCHKMPFQLSAAFALVRSLLAGAEKNEESEERRHSDTHLVTREGRQILLSLMPLLRKREWQSFKEGWEGSIKF